MNVQTQGTLTTPEQFGRIVLRANPDGTVLRISDVARIELGAKNEDTETRINGRPSVGIALYLAPDANAVQTATAVSRTLARLGGRFPPGLKARVVYDSTVFVMIPFMRYCGRWASLCHCHHCGVSVSWQSACHHPVQRPFPST